MWEAIKMALAETTVGRLQVLSVPSLLVTEEIHGTPSRCLDQDSRLNPKLVTIVKTLNEFSVLSFLTTLEPVKELSYNSL
jgi:hypothetical protein